MTIDTDSIAASDSRLYGRSPESMASLRSERANKTPPLGLRPRKNWLEARFKEVLEALARYTLEGKDIPSEWIAELSSLQFQIYEAKL